MPDPQKIEFDFGNARELETDVTGVLYGLRQLVLTTHEPQALVALDEAVGFLQGALLSLRDAAHRMGQ